MRARFIDTNIVLRYLLNDDPVQSPAALTLLLAVEEGRETVWTSDFAVAEMVFIMSNRRYALSRAEIRDKLLALLQLPGIHLPQKHLYERTFDLYTTLPIDFIDAYHAALIEYEQQSELWSFDTDFDRIPTLRRFEPQVDG